MADELSHFSLVENFKGRAKHGAKERCKRTETLLGDLGFVGRLGGAEHAFIFDLGKHCFEQLRLFRSVHLIIKLQR